MNGPDWLEITILLQGNFTAVFSFGGAAPETPRQAGDPKSRCHPPLDPPCSDYFTGGVAAPFWTGAQCGGTIEDNQTPHPTCTIQLKKGLDIIDANQVMETLHHFYILKCNLWFTKELPWNENMSRNYFSLIIVNRSLPWGGFSCQTTALPGSCTDALSLRHCSRWSLQQVALWWPFLSQWLQ